MALRDYRSQTRAPAPGRAPQISLKVAADSSGAEAVGRGLMDMGTAAMQIQQSRDAIAINDARLAITEGMGALNADLTEDRDFGTMRERYGARLDELGKTTLETLPPRLRQTAELEFARARIGAEASIFRRQNELEGGHARATLARQLRSSANAVAAAASPEEANEQYNTAMSSIGELEAAGHLTAEQAEAMRQEFDGTTAYTVALDSINRDPAAALAILEQPGGFGLDEDKRVQLHARALRISEAAAKQAENELERRAETAQRILVTGGTVDAAELEALREDAAGTEHAAKIEGAVLAGQELGGFYEATPEAQAARIAELTAQGISIEDASIDGARLRSMEQIAEKAATDLARDPIAYATKAGLPGAGAVDLSDQKTLDARMSLVMTLTEDYGAPVQIFSVKEQEALAEKFETGSVEDQLALGVSLLDGFGPGAKRAFDELEVDPVTRRAAELVMETGRDTIPRVILAGRKAMESGDELRLVGQDALAVFEDGLDQAFPGGGGERERMIEAAKAYYAAKAPGRVKAGSLSEQTDLLSEAIGAVTGGVMIDGVQYGGVQEVNGLGVKLPPEMSAATVEGILDRATADDWRAASLTGNLPHEGESEVTPDGGAVLRWVEGSIYALETNGYYGREGYMDPHPEAPGGRFYVDLSKLGASVAKRPQEPGFWGRLFRGPGDKPRGRDR